MHLQALVVLIGLAAASVMLGHHELPPGARPRGAEAQGATALSVATCTEVEQGEDFEIEITISNVTGLDAWEVYFAYDQDLLEVTAREVRLLLDEAPNSNVFDFSDPVPNTTGLYRLGAADISTEGSAESGSGTLARIHLHAKEKGVSWAVIYRGDLNDDDLVDLGPILTGDRGSHIGDSDGDRIFDGTVQSGQVAVERSCSSPAPTAPPPQGTVIVPTISPTVSATGATPAGAQSVTPAAVSTATPPGDDATPDEASSTARATPDRTDGEGDGGGGSGLWVIAGIISAAVAAVIGAGWTIRAIRRNQ